VPVEHGDIRNLTNTAAFAERDPAWSPNGNGLRIFRMSPANMRCTCADKMQWARCARSVSEIFPRSLFAHWSPDSKKIAFSDKRLNLWYLDIEAEKPILVDTNPYDGRDSIPRGRRTAAGLRTRANSIAR